MVASAVAPRAVHSQVQRGKGRSIDQVARKQMNSHTLEMSPSIARNNGISVLIIYFMTDSKIKEVGKRLKGFLKLSEDPFAANLTTH